MSPPSQPEGPLNVTQEEGLLDGILDGAGVEGENKQSDEGEKEDGDGAEDAKTHEMAKLLEIKKCSAILQAIRDSLNFSA